MLLKVISLTTLFTLIFQSTIYGAGTKESEQIRLDVSVANPTMLANKKQSTFVKVGLQGPTVVTDETRAPVNVALVIDKSGSMRGAKIEKAKQAAIAAIERLRDDDILSVVVYHDGVQVIYPATKLTDKEAAKSAIRTIYADGSTALFAGVSKGSAEVRKFLDSNRVNRVLLLSDGQANVGPDSPSELAELGASLQKEHIAVTTLGLGLNYNEDLMTNLAMRSNGNHRFIEDADDLFATFDREFNDVLSVVAQEISVTIDVPEGVRPIRVLGHEAEIHGQHISIQLNQLYANQERFALIEVEVPSTPHETTREIASVQVKYANLKTKKAESQSATTSVRFSNDVTAYEADIDQDVEEKSILLIANEQNRRATVLRDQGNLSEARRVLVTNYLFLSKNALELNSPLLEQQQALNITQARNLDDQAWKKTRKLMRRDNAAVAQQAPGYGGYGAGYGGGYGSSSSEGYRKAGDGYGGRGGGGGGYHGGYGGYGGVSSHEYRGGDSGSTVKHRQQADLDLFTSPNQTHQQDPGQTASRSQRMQVLIDQYRSELAKWQGKLPGDDPTLVALKKAIADLEARRTNLNSTSAPQDQDSVKKRRRTGRGGY